MPKSRKLSPQTLMVLRALTAQPGKWRYGYDLTKETSLRAGTLYPLLMRLADQGILESRWESSPHPGRPPRHAYRLTSLGISVASPAGSGSLPTTTEGLARA
jgi:DNA-binding PadR family transcriptional regulator